MAKMITRDFHWCHQHDGLTPAQTTDLVVGWIKLSNKPFIELHEIQCYVETIWAVHASSTQSYVFNKSLTFRKREHGNPMFWTYFHQAVSADFVQDFEWNDTGATCVECSSGSNPDRNKYWRYLENPTHSFHGAIFPSQLYVVAGIGGSDNIATYAGNVDWYANFTFKEYTKKTHALAALIQRRKLHT